MAATKKFLDLEGLKKYDAKIKGAMDEKDAAKLQEAKSYADGLASNYEPAGSANTAKNQAIEDAKGYTDTKVGEANGKIDAVTATAQAAQQAAQTATETANATKALVGTIPEDAGVTTVVEYVNKKTEGAANTEALNALNGKVTTLIGNDAGKSARTIANEELAAQLIPESAKESLNTLKEIADWIQKHPDDVAGINSEISKLKTLVGALPAEGVTAHDVTGYIAEVKAALEQSVAAEKSRAEGVEGAINAKVSTLEGKAHQHANANVLEAISNEKVASWDGAATAKHEHANKGALDKVNDGKITAWDAAEGNAKKYTDNKLGEFQAISDEELNALFAPVAQ